MRWLWIALGSIVLVFMGGVGAHFMGSQESDAFMGERSSVAVYRPLEEISLQSGVPQAVRVPEKEWSPFFRLEPGCYLDLSPTPEKACDWVFLDGVSVKHDGDQIQNAKQSDPRVRKNVRRLVAFRIREGQGPVLTVCSYREDGAMTIVPPVSVVTPIPSPSPSGGTPAVVPPAPSGGAATGTTMIPPAGSTTPPAGGH